MPGSASPRDDDGGVPSSDELVKWAEERSTSSNRSIVEVAKKYLIPGREALRYYLIIIMSGSAGAYFGVAAERTVELSSSTRTFQIAGMTFLLVALVLAEAFQRVWPLANESDS